MEIVKVIVGIIVLSAIIIVGGCGLIVAVHYWLDNVPTVCRVDGVEVFVGRSACINVKSSGASTTVAIGRGPFCMLPGAYYVSNDVVLVGVKQ
jgi:hypothetical protein